MDDKKKEEKDVLKDLGDAKALDVLNDSKGGKLLIKALKADIVTNIGLVTAGYAKMSEVELRAKLASLANYISLIKTMTKARDNVEVIESFLKNLTK